MGIASCRNAICIAKHPTDIKDLTKEGLIRFHAFKFGTKFPKVWNDFEKGILAAVQRRK